MAGSRPLVLLALSACLMLGGAGGRAEASDAAGILRVLEGALTPEQVCEVEFLRHLGWHFKTDARVTELTVHGGEPGRHKDLATAHAAGALRIRVPPGFDEADARSAAGRLMELAQSVPSRLAYCHRLVRPVRRATRRLADMTEAGRHQFPEIFDLFHSPMFRLQMPLTEWTPRDKMYVATNSPTRALEAFYRLGSTSECYVGQLLALYGIQYELLGRDWFDRILTKDEMVVGRPSDVVKTPLLSLLEYEVAPEWCALVLRGQERFRDPILGVAAHGPIALTGLAGVVLNQDKGCFTQDNVVIVSATQRALDELVNGGGVEFFNRETARLWECGNKGKDGLIDVAGLFTIGEITAGVEKQMDVILARPMFSEIQVYVHPDGVVPLAFTVKKFVKRTDTPVTLRINLNGLENEFYQRYRKAFLQGCMAQRGTRASTATAPEIAGR